MSREQAAWELAQVKLVSMLPISTYEYWVKPLYAVGVTNQDEIVFQGPKHVVPWSRRRYGELIAEAITETSDFKGVYLGTRSRKD